MQKDVFVLGGHPSQHTHLPPVVRGKERMRKCVDVHSVECVSFSPAFSSRRGVCLCSSTPPAVFSEFVSVKTQKHYIFCFVLLSYKLKYSLKEINNNK